NGLSKLVRDTVVRSDLNDLRVVLIGLGRVAESALVAELHVVGAGDVRQRRPQAGEVPDQRMRKAALPGCAWHPGEEAREAVSSFYTTRLTGLLQPLDHCWVVGSVVALPEAVPSLIHAPTSLGQQLARDR